MACAPDPVVLGSPCWAKSPWRHNTVSRLGNSLCGLPAGPKELFASFFGSRGHVVLGWIDLSFEWHHLGRHRPGAVVIDDTGLDHRRDDLTKASRGESLAPWRALRPVSFFVRDQAGRYGAMALFTPAPGEVAHPMRAVAPRTRWP